MDGEKFEALAYTQSIIKPDSIISWNNSFKKDFFLKNHICDSRYYYRYKWMAPALAHLSYSQRDSLRTWLNFDPVREYTWPQWDMNRFAGSSKPGLSLSNSGTSGYCHLEEKNPVELVSMYYIFLFHIRQKTKRSEDEVSRESTSVSAVTYFLFLFISPFLLMGIVSPRIHLKNLDEVINLISSCC